ncbi:hypothetical protein BKA82DRAFT_134095 [Pisolithus tinctorius]|uniref:EamA domain-containing protein n=1 Tax=Pisolithus tinctorius Marx 270 TaxID=870435 RepID=A0A0C3PJ57_PISTI|nr:hypothetical protein BKA82DRAFT_134095 [Pisolithus tinctorius]KIO08174.1 hypothetical protein M404DRAFT_134095 [Pisolithus tinctorius Marx 270]
MVSDDSNGTRSRSDSRTLKDFATSNYIIGICLLLVVVILWTLSNFVTQYMFVGGYQKPFLVTYTSTSAFTCYLIPFYLRHLRGRYKDTSYQPLAQDIPSEPNSSGFQRSYNETLRLTPRETAWLALYFSFLWFTANWSLNAALAYTSVASATVLSSMSGIFTLVVGRVFHVEAVTIVKIGAVLLSFGGVVLVSFSDSQDPGPYSMTRPFYLLPVIGDILALLSALLYAMYMIFLKVKIREESRIDMQLFFGFVGLFNIFLCWPIGLLLHIFGVERLELPNTRQALVAIIVNMFITLSSDYIYVIAMLKTTPLVVTIGLSLTIPLAVTGDFFLGKPAAAQVVIGALFVLFGFIVVGVENAKKESCDYPVQNSEETRLRAQVPP